MADETALPNVRTNRPPQSSPTHTNVKFPAAADTVSSSNPLGDDRFGAMFESSAFEVDPESEEYARAHPTSLIANKMVSATCNVAGLIAFASDFFRCGR